MKIYYCDGVYYATKKEAMARALTSDAPDGYVDELTINKLDKRTAVALANNRGWAAESKTIFTWNKLETEEL